MHWACLTLHALNDLPLLAPNLSPHVSPPETLFLLRCELGIQEVLQIPCGHFDSNTWAVFWWALFRRFFVYKVRWQDQR